MRIESPRAAIADLAFQFLGPFARVGNLKATHLEERRDARLLADFLVQLHRPARQLADGFGIVMLEHQAGRLRSGPPVLEERSLVEHDHVTPAFFGQLIRRAATDNPAAYDDDASLFLHGDL